MWLVQAHEEAIPGIEARESMLLSRAVALGSGQMNKAAKGKTWNEWNRLANGGRGALKPGLKDVAALFGFPILEEKNE